MESNEKNRNISVKIGRAIGSIFFGCVGLSCCALVIALTAKLIMWMF